MTAPFHERLRAARERAQLSQGQLATQIGVSQRTVGNWETGTTVPRNRLGALEEALGVQLREGTAIPWGENVEERRAGAGRTLADLATEASGLTPRQQEAVLAVVRAMRDPGAEDAGGQLVDLTRPPMPDLSRVAARHGESEGRRIREEQDDTLGS